MITQSISSCPSVAVLPLRLRLDHGETSLQAEPELRGLGVQRETWHGWLRPCLLLPTPCECGAHCILTLAWHYVKRNRLCVCSVAAVIAINRPAGGHVLLSVLQVTNEKLAVKMCRLELTPRNKDRWSREIMIMKKFVHFMAFSSL